MVNDASPTRLGFSEVNETNPPDGADFGLSLVRLANEMRLAQNAADPPFLPRYDYLQNVLRSEFEEGLDRVQEIPTSENPANFIRPGDVLKIVGPTGRTEFFEVLPNGTVRNGRAPISLQLMLQMNRGSTIYRLPAGATG